jgi:hypothetical protein
MSSIYCLGSSALASTSKYCIADATCTSHYNIWTSTRVAVVEATNCIRTSLLLSSLLVSASIFVLSAAAHK